MQPSTTGTPRSPANRIASSVAPSASLRRTALIGFPVYLLNSRAARTLPFGTVGRFCSVVRWRTYGHAPPPPTPPGETTVQSSGTSSRTTIWNFFPWASAALTRDTEDAVLLLRLA